MAYLLFKEEWGWQRHQLDWGSLVGNICQDFTCQRSENTDEKAVGISLGGQISLVTDPGVNGALSTLCGEGVQRHAGPWHDGRHCFLVQCDST